MYKKEPQDKKLILWMGWPCWKN